MTKITAATRAALKQVLTDSHEYDASTMRITADGVVTARKDADKTANPYDMLRYDVGHVSIILDAAGNRREGW